MSGVGHAIRWCPTMHSRYADCWRSDDSAGIAEFLREFAAVHRPFPVNEVRLQECSCSGRVFNVDCACSACQLRCIACGSTQLLCPANSSWAESVEESDGIDDYACDECVHCEFEAAIGKTRLSADDTSQPNVWVNLGVRCRKCGLFACPHTYCWPRMTACPFDPSWLCELARRFRPDLSWLPDQLARCRVGTWNYHFFVQFVDSTNANAPGAAWQFREVIDLPDPRRGMLKLNVLKDDRIGAIEFYDRLFVQHLMR